MSERRYYRNVYTIEILSDEELQGGESLAEIEYGITEGHWSGEVTHTVANEEVDALTMRGLLIAQRSDPGFLIPEDEDGDADD